MNILISNGPVMSKLTFDSQVLTRVQIDMILTAYNDVMRRSKIWERGMINEVSAEAKNIHDGA